MASLKLFLTTMFVLMPLIANACPSCALSNNGRFINQTILVVGVMWLVPVLVATYIGFKICQLCESSGKPAEKDK